MPTIVLNEGNVIVLDFMPYIGGAYGRGVGFRRIGGCSKRAAATSTRRWPLGGIQLGYRMGNIRLERSLYLLCKCIRG